jgi:hypothetical protein
MPVLKRLSDSAEEQTVKRFDLFLLPFITGLKPGVNERETFRL